MSRIAIFCPGRGSYTAKSLGLLPKDHPWVREAEALRADYGLASLLELDNATQFGEDHLRADNASPLIYLHTMLDATEAMGGNDVVCVGGNSMGWYTSLAVAGALDFADGFRLVQEMALLQMEHVGGGQVLYPLVGEDWRADDTLIGNVRTVLASSNGEAHWSICLGGFAVLAGTEQGVTHLLSELPAVEHFPFRLKGHGPYHTPLLREVAAKAERELMRLEFRAPRVTLIDGRGAQFSPWSTSPAALAAYTLGEQITTPYGFTTSVRVALREYAPERLALPGPENTLGAVCGQIVIAERWRGIDRRAALDDHPQLVWSLRR